MGLYKRDGNFNGRVCRVGVKMLIVFLVILVVAVVVGEILYEWEENRNEKRKK